MSSTEIRVAPDDWAGALANTDGHQIIVAGPGTGKTEFLVRRVSHIVQEGLARRDQIAVLCFSRRAAADIGARIETAVGSTGTPVDATTFHSLALRLLETAASGDRLVPLTTPEQVGVVEGILKNEDPADWPLTYQGILTTPAFAAEVADFLMRCSERLLAPSDLDERARERADWKGLPALYERYLEHLGDHDRTDYGVLLATAVALLRTKEGEELATNYRYVLVDEYQDTSPAQAEMAKLLAQPHGNLTVTGDPYQSIYSFRGAELRNVADFQEAHPDATRVVLSRSFRVPAAIMQSALRVVSGGMLPGAAGPVEPATHQGRVDSHLFDQETAEAEWIAREVERAILIDRVDPSSIAVLVRSKKELLNELSRALDRRGISHDPPDSRLVDHPAIRLFQDLVAVAVSGDATLRGDTDRAMRRILLGPLVGLSLGREREIVRGRQRSSVPWAAVLREELPDFAEISTLVGDPRWATDGSAADGFWHAWSSLGAIEGLIRDADRADWRRAWSAFAQVLGRQAERDPSLSLVRYFELTEEGDFEATPLFSHRPGAKRVTLTTLHQAKGLEFDVVFIANAVEGVFPDLRRSRRMLRPELLSPERTTDANAQHVFQLQEEMRLAYTAMTRARMRVVWTATDAGVDQGEHRPSRFLVAAAGVDRLDEIGPPERDAGEAVTLSGAEIALRRQLADPGVGVVDRLTAAAVLATPADGWWDPIFFPGVPEAGPDSPLLGESIRLSPSQVDRYQQCPRLYALERRLRLGDAGSPYAHLGALVHRALELAEREVIGTGRRHAELDRALEVLGDVWEEEADFGTPQLDQAWLVKAVDAVTKLYENWPNKDGQPVAVEETVKATIADVPWMGIIDRLEETDEGLRVVDYKTSTNPPTKDEAAVSIQLAFYASAVSRRGPVIGAEMWFPRTKAQTVSTRALDLERSAEVFTQMEELTRSILAEEWSPTPGDHCKRCSFRTSCPAWPEGRGAYLP